MGRLQMIRKPDYERGRFFISPLLGCNASCRFCYIYDKGYTKKAIRNEFDIPMVMDFLESHESFSKGIQGSIISIGAWGDPFPRYNKELCTHSLEWLKKISELQNPIQIMSRYELNTEIINGIVECNKYKGHILYSTSISSINNFRKIEPYADDPINRLRSIETLDNLGVATNVMIKPFIPGITDIDVDNIAKALKDHNVRQCVVGDLLLDDTIKIKLSEIGFRISELSDMQVLDCTSGESYELGNSGQSQSFCQSISELGIKVFRKSSCVNSYILNRPNPANYINFDPNNYCIKCGVCK